MRPLLLSLLLVACGPVTELASHREAILGGADEPSASTTFLLDLRFDNGASICSAVLVSPRVLLTAAHCVDPAFHGATTVTVRAMNKPDISNLMMSDTTLVTLISRHPGWAPSGSGNPKDLAALLLESAPAGVTPASLGAALPANPLGLQLQVLGYGRTSTNGSTTSGTRRSVTLPITGSTAAELNYGSDNATGICSGDSGGPSFLNGAVVGIHSRNPTTTCGRGVDIRIDANRAFIDAFITTNDPPMCVADGVCPAGCGASDPDCLCRADGRCDMGCGATVDPDCRCVADGRCDANCGATVDPDCTCVADGRCDMGCGATVDPDCTCVADGRCDANCGATVDPDCACVADGRCEANCGATVDPDCACVADGRCDPGCGGAGDPDCGCVADNRCEPGCTPTDPDCLEDGAVCTDANLCTGAQCLNDARGFQFCSRTCTATTECQADMTCQGGLCRAPPKDPGPVTAGCSASGPGVLVVLGLALARRRRRRVD